MNDEAWFCSPLCHTWRISLSEAGAISASMSVSYPLYLIWITDGGATR